MSPKWYEFGSPLEGNGLHTVVVGGLVLRKNQLGNIEFMLIHTLFPVLSAEGAVDQAYNNLPGGTYWSEHPYSRNWSNWRVLHRGDNLAAFGVGQELANRI